MGGKTGMAFFPGPSGSNVYCEDPDDSRTYPYWDPSFVPLAKESFKRATTVTGVHYQQPGVIISRGDRCIQEGDSSLTSPDEVSRGAQVGALVEYFCQDNLIVNHFNAYCKSEFDYSYGCESGRCVKQYPEFSILSVLSAPSVYSPNKQVFWLKLFDTGKNIIPAGNIIKVCRKESLQQSSCDKIYEFRSLGIQGHTFPPEMLIGYNTLSPIRVFIGTSTDFDKYNPNNNWDDAPLTNPIRDAYFIVDPFNEYQELDESNIPCASIYFNLNILVTKCGLTLVTLPFFCKIRFWDSAIVSSASSNETLARLAVTVPSTSLSTSRLSL